MRPILVVDDNHDDVFFLQRALADCGVKNPVQAVYGGKESLIYLRGDPPYNDRERERNPPHCRQTGAENRELKRTLPETVSA
jgi:CheY-like chemotaxis protein